MSPSTFALLAFTGLALSRASIQIHTRLPLRKGRPDQSAATSKKASRASPTDKDDPFVGKVVPTNAGREDATALFCAMDVMGVSTFRTDSKGRLVGYRWAAAVPGLLEDRTNDADFDVYFWKTELLVELHEWMVESLPASDRVRGVHPRIVSPYSEDAVLLRAVFGEA